MKKRLLSIVLILVMVMNLGVLPAFAAGNATLEISPNTTELKAGDVVTVTATVPQVSGIASGLLKLTFDKATLEVQSIDAPATFAGYGTTVTSVPTANNVGALSISIGNGATHNFDMPEALVLSVTFVVRDTASAGAKANLVAIDTNNYYFEDEDSTEVTAPTFNKTSISATVVSKLSGALAITGVTAPIKNATPVEKNAVTAPANTTITALTWNPAVGGTFAGDTAYTATIGIKANSGYVFADGVTFTVDGNAWTSVKQQDGSYNLTKTFPATAGKDTPTCNAPSVNATYGQKLSNISLSNPVGNTAGTWSWMDSTQSVGDVGTHTFKARFTPTDTANYMTVENIDVSVTVSAKNITVTIADIADLEYTGNQLKPTVTVTGDDKTLVLNTDYTVEYGTNVSVGSNSGTVTVKAKAGGNYTFSNTTKYFNIVAQAGQVTISGNLDVTYGTEVPNVSIDKHGSTGTTTVYYYTNEACTTGETTTKPTNVGSYWVKVKMAADANYGAAESDVLSFTISRANITPVVNITGWTYGSSANAPSVSGNTGNGTVTYAYKVRNTNDNTYSSAVPTQAGDYTVKATVAQTTNYNGGFATKDFTISPKTISGATIADVANQPYNNGTAITPTPAVSDGGTPLTVGTDFTYSYENNINAGTATVKITGKGNYTGTASKTFQIIRADLAITVSITGWVVGGTPNAPSVSGNLGNGAVTYQYKVKDAGDNTYSSTVPTAEGNYTVKATVAQTANYNAASAMADFAISTKAPQTVTAGNLTVKYGDTDKAVSASTNGDGTISYFVKSGSEYVEVNSSTGALTIKKVGTATITVTASETSAYAPATKDITVTVNPKEISAPSADTTVFTYNGQNQTYGITETANYTVSNGVQKNASTYQVTVALKDKTNTVWADSQNTTDKTFDFEIKKATITIAAKNKSAYVNETAPTLGESDYTVSGLVPNETLKTLPAIAYASTPDMTQTGTVTIKVSGAAAPDGGNYNDIVYTDGTLTISTKPSIGGGGGVTTYSITVDSAKNGTITVSPKSAAKGATVTITVKPDEGYELDTLKVVDKNGDKVKLTEKDGKYTFTMPASKVTVTGTFAMVNPFIDVKESDYFYKAVLWAFKNGITDGTSANTFSPNANCTRAQMVTFLWRASGSPKPVTDVCPFTDVNMDSYYGKAVLWAVETGITNGTSETTFSPEADCTRAQMAAFLCRIADGKAVSNTIGFTDVSADAYYAESVQWAVENGITLGTGDGTTFSPNEICTRAQMVTFLYRFFVK